MGDVFHVSDHSVSPLRRPFARVIFVYSGPDLFVRVVNIETATGIQSRPEHKMRKSIVVKKAA